jgi:hypothetical protein
MDSCLLDLSMVYKCGLKRLLIAFMPQYKRYASLRPKPLCVGRIRA